MIVKLKNKNYNRSTLNARLDAKFNKKGKIIKKFTNNEIVCVKWDDDTVNFYDFNDLIFLSGENKKDNFNSIW